MRQKLGGDRRAAQPFRTFASGFATPASRVSFRFRDGRMKSLPYLQLVETEYNPDVGIILEFVGNRVTIAGRNLLDLYDQFEDEMIGEVQEQHVNEMAIPEDAPYIAHIVYERI